MFLLNSGISVKIALAKEVRGSGMSLGQAEPEEQRGFPCVSSSVMMTSNVLNRGSSFSLGLRVKMTYNRAGDGPRIRNKTCC